MKILVAIQKPPDDQHASVERWYKTISTCDIQAKQRGVSDKTKLGQGAWQLTEESHLQMLAIVLAQADGGQFSYRVEFDGEPASWKYAPPVSQS